VSDQEIRFHADEDVDGDIMRALKKNHPEIDCVRVQDVGLRSAADTEILSWAATARRVVVSHDVNTMTAAARTMKMDDASMAGLVIVSRRASISAVVEGLFLLAACNLDGECENRIMFVSGN
jgi:hypothetical protein